MLADALQLCCVIRRETRTGMRFQELDGLGRYRLAGRVRRCEGTRLVCGGLSGLVGLGDVCVIERPRHLEQALERLRAEPFVTSTRSMVVLSRLVETPSPTPLPN